MRKFTNILSSLRAAYTNRTDPEGVQLLARAYWRFILTVSIIAIVASIIFGTMQLLEVFGTFQTRQSADAILPITLDRAKLDATLSGFDARRQVFESLPASTSTFPDPSR